MAGIPIRLHVHPDVNAARADDIVRVAGLVRPGEWTTYGDVSAAALGNGRWARLVGTIAATDERFPNAHRILTAEGRISRPGGDTGAARSALENEGVVFVRDRADRARRVHWDQLQRRDGRVARHTG